MLSPSAVNVVCASAASFVPASEWVVNEKRSAWPQRVSTPSSSALRVAGTGQGRSKLQELRGGPVGRTAPLLAWNGGVNSNSILADCMSPGSEQRASGGFD